MARFPRRGRRLAATTALAFALTAGACGGDETAGAPTMTVPSEELTAPEAATTVPSTSAATTAASTTAPTTATLPGEPFEIGFPRDDDVLGVVGVEFDDVLSVRALPGFGQEVVATLEPTTGGVVATGRARLLPDGSIWNEVAVDDATGWVPNLSVAYIGGTDDITSRVVDALGGRPAAATMLELGLIVAESVASTDPPSRITVTVAPTVADLGEVTYDVAGLADDSVFGFRLHVFGQPGESGADFSLGSVESTSLCLRGVTRDGLCI